MKNMEIFKSLKFGSVRTLTINHEPWFVGKDVAEILGYAKPENAIANHVDEEDKTSTLIQGSGSNYKSKAEIFAHRSVSMVSFSCASAFLIS